MQSMSLTHPLLLDAFVHQQLSDLHSCVTAAIGTLRGPLHGGANEAAMAMIEQCAPR